ncbi:hypothetical protein J6590_087504 [Homalodisca vitripennis]|nr:hypothetical protein J6590_087504 [Homalodisca vitripennis]
MSIIRSSREGADAKLVWCEENNNNDNQEISLLTGVLTSSMDNISGDLFVGEAKLFFMHPRHFSKSPFRLAHAPASLIVRIANPDMVLICDSRIDAGRVAKTLIASDIATDTAVSPHEPDNSSRWTNLVETTDGRHWSDGEYSYRARTSSLPGSKRAGMRVESSLALFVAQLTPSVAEAVTDGRAIVISRANNFVDVGVRARHLFRAYGNHVFALYETGTEEEKPDRQQVTALMIVGRFWPKQTQESHRPVLTVARHRRVRDAGPGGRIFCLCLGTHLATSLAGFSAEDVARSKNHYEGYFGDLTYKSMFSTRDALFTI